MSLADQGLPRVIQGLDVRTLPLGPEEAFVLSRIDGRTPPAEIALATGLSETRVLECLRRLAELKAISFGTGTTIPKMSAPGPTAQPTPTPRPTSSVRLRPAVEAPAPRFTPHPASLNYDPALLDEPADLDRERKKLILDRYFALEQLTHYAILEVAEDASKEQIKEAYYQRVGLFHPDRYFGKDLGSFKPKLEKVFGALTKAYDTLTRKRSREEYDRYLAARRRTAPLRPSLPPTRLTPAPAPAPSEPPRPVPAVAPPRTPAFATPLPTPSMPPLGTSSVPPVPSSSRIPVSPAASSAPVSSAPVSSAPVSSAPVSSAPARSPSAPTIESAPNATTAPTTTTSSAPPQDGAQRASSIPSRPSSIPPDPEAARRVLARKLLGNRASAPPPPPGSGADAAAVANAVSGDLKARFAKRLEDATHAQIERYRRIAEEALAAGQLGSAVNALKVALTAAPDDPELTRLLEETQAKADVALADQFLEQARYEEKDGRLAKAAQAYERAARGKRSASLYDRAASCLVEARENPRKAIELARKAVELDGERASFRITLARAFHLANMPTSASRELQRALELAPDNDEIRTWIKRLR